jgi:hypothetical protein
VSDVGYDFAPVMSVARTMKEFGLTGIPVQRIENASATGSAAFRGVGDAAPPRSWRHEFLLASFVVALS